MQTLKKELKKQSKTTLEMLVDMPSYHFIINENKRGE